MARDALEVQSYMYMYMHAVETFQWFVVKFRYIALSFCGAWNHLYLNCEIPKSKQLSAVCNWRAPH